MRAAPASPLSLLAAATTAMPTPSPAGDELRDIKDIVPLPHIWPWWYWLLGAVLMALVLLLIYLARARKKERVASMEPTPDQAALQALDRALALARNGDAKQFAVLVTDILRRYIEARFSLHAPALTTREFLASVAENRNQHPGVRGERRDESQAYQAGRGPGFQIKNIADELINARQTLADILLACDQAKFAGAALSRDEMEKIATRVAAFIRATRAREADK